MQPIKLLAAGVSFLCVLTIAAAPAPKPVKVFILAGQSNMEGQGVADLDGKDYNDGKGTLQSHMQDAAKAALFKHLKDSQGHWTVRNDVWVRYQPEDGPLKAGPLTLGFTPYDGRHHFGPELQFGHVLGDYLANRVLLIKTAWGGKSLYKDFRPPSSGGAVGPYYTKMISEIREALANLKTDFPSYDGGGYELAGFVWYHGWNDGCEPKTAVPEYEQNLVNFIKDVRKGLNAPRLPFVIGELTGPWVEAPGEWATLRKAQAAAATRAEFQGTVTFVPTHDFVRDPEDSPNPGHGHHEFGNAETYFLVGDALGNAMKRLLAAKPAAETGSIVVTPQPPEPGQASVLADKTLVVWTAPANLTQRGGSVLTLEDASDHFDGIVFGEIAPGKWMAGSDMFARTQQEQSNYASETADSETLVQLAIVYRGKQVTLYRNGAPHAQYEIPASLQEFGPRSMVLFGKRHRHQSDNAHFAGTIDDARIYDRALSKEQIAALKPNESSSIPPWAWWSFDGSEAKERTGRFPITQLTGAARVEAGKLVLDGKTGTMLCKTGKELPFAFETPTRPENPPTNWLSYHLAHPGPGTAMPGDPNCAFYWKGRYHLHYIYTHKDGFSFAHVSSTDLLHWRWHPTTLTPPKMEHGMFSGTGFFDKEGRPAIIYHGQGSGRNQIAIAEDDQLEKWSAPMALEPKILPGQDESKIAHWDPDAWVNGDNYYAISGGSPGSGKPPTLFKSPDLKNWDYLGLFLTKDMPDVQPDEDISCPNFFKIGNKHMLLCISHNKGCRYYLGRWKNEKFTPAFHARMNWKGWDFFAPESLLTRDGRRVMWAWCNVGEPQSGIQSLPRELSLPRDGVLRIKPLRELETLRLDEKREKNLTVKREHPYMLREIAGDDIELKISLKPGTAKEFGVEVYCDQDGKGGFPISINPASKTLSLGSVQAPFELRAGEKLELRVFLDKTMIEVFANDRQAVVASHRYLPGNLGVSLFSKGGSVIVKDARGWRMKSVYANR